MQTTCAFLYSCLGIHRNNSWVKEERGDGEEMVTQYAGRDAPLQGVLCQPNLFHDARLGQAATLAQVPGEQVVGEIDISQGGRLCQAVCHILYAAHM